MTDLNPQAKQMADESMVRGLDAQARAIWPPEVEPVRRYVLPDEARLLDAGCGAGEGSSRSADLFRERAWWEWTSLMLTWSLPRSRYASFAPRLRFEHQSIFELDPQGYAVWMVPVVSARVPLAKSA